MLLEATEQALDQVAAVLEKLAEYSDIEQSKYYSENNVGCHIRHIIDHFIALKVGLKTDTVNYNLRSRGSDMERQIPLAQYAVTELQSWLPAMASKLKHPVSIISEIACFQTHSQVFSSTVERELLYMINHTVHHLAYISLLLKHEGVYLPKYIGVAPSTLSHVRDATY